MIRMSVLLAAVSAFVLSAPAARADEVCAAHKWPAGALLAADPAPAASGDTLHLAPGPSAFALALSAVGETDFPIPPERAPAPESYGAVVSAAPPEGAGLYAIALSERAWIDVVQGGGIVPSTDFSGAQDCPLHKIVRFDLAAAPFTIQLSGAAEPSLLLVVAPAEE